MGDGGAFGYQKTFGADESFSVHDLAVNLASPRTKIVDKDGLVVEEIATHHGDCPSLAYRIAYKNRVVVFSGDMDASALPNLVQLAKDADLLIFNCAVLDPPGSPSQLYELHTPPKKIGEAAHQSAVKSLLLSHLAPECRKSKGGRPQIHPRVLRRTPCVCVRPAKRSCWEIVHEHLMLR